jgi:selenocysteine lyase/cysteine desulfurase
VDARSLDRRTFLGAAGLALAPFAEIRERFDRALAAHQDEELTRADYTLDPRVTYLNHGSIGTIPRVVQDAHKGYLDRCETNPWLYLWGGAWEEAREATRARAAALLGGDAADVALVRNTTEGFNLLAAGLPLGEGDEVVFSSLNHHGASVPFEHHAAARGYRVRKFAIPFDRVPVLTRDEVVDLHAEAIGERTRLLVLPHVDNEVGLRHPVREIAAVAHERGVEFVACDGAQSLGMFPFDVPSLGVDFYCASPHKWVQSPKGQGLLWVRAEHRATLRPSTVTWGQERWHGTVRVFEDYGTRDLPAVLALGDAIAFQRQRGQERNADRLTALRERARERVRADARLSWRSPEDAALSASLYAIGLPGQAEAAGQHLWQEHGIVVRAFGELETLRVSPNAANTLAEIDRLFEVVREILG